MDFCEAVLLLQFLLARRLQLHILDFTTWRGVDCEREWRPYKSNNRNEKFHSTSLGLKVEYYRNANSRPYF
jgi:hypothetical protein